MVFSSLLTAVEQGNTVDIVTVIESTRQHDVGKMLMIYASGKVEGQWDELIAEQIVNQLYGKTWLTAETFYIEDQSGGKYRILWDRMISSSMAIVFGGGHISQPLVQMLALLDFKVTVIDDRPEFANRERFPGAQQVICESFQQSFKQLTIDEHTAVIIVTRGHKYDMDCLRATMDSKARYLGMIGSKRRIREVLTVLREEGMPEGLERRLKAPIGLDIKAETPAEIAVSIVAEVVAVFRGKISSLALSSAEEELR